MEEVKVGEGPIIVMSDTGTYELARIDPVDGEKEALAEMILVQTCSLLDVSLFPGIQASYMGLKSPKTDKPIHSTELIPFGSTVYLYARKGLEEEPPPDPPVFSPPRKRALETVEYDPRSKYGSGDMFAFENLKKYAVEKIEEPREVLYNNSVFASYVPDEQIMLIEACHTFGLNPSDHYFGKTISGKYLLLKKPSGDFLMCVFVRCNMRQVFRKYKAKYECRCKTERSKLLFRFPQPTTDVRCKSKRVDAYKSPLTIILSRMLRPTTGTGTRFAMMN